MQAEQALGIVGVTEIALAPPFEELSGDDALGFDELVEKWGQFLVAETQGRGNLAGRHRRAIA